MISSTSLGSICSYSRRSSFCIGHLGLHDGILHHHLLYDLCCYHCNPLLQSKHIMEDNSISVLKLETLKALVIGHGFDSLHDKNISHRYFADNISSDKLTTNIEVHKFMSSLLVLCWTQIDSIQIVGTFKLVFTVSWLACTDWHEHRICMTQCNVLYGQESWTGSISCGGDVVLWDLLFYWE